MTKQQGGLWKKDMIIDKEHYRVVSDGSSYSSAVQW